MITEYIVRVQSKITGEWVKASKVFYCPKDAISQAKQIRRDSHTMLNARVTFGDSPADVLFCTTGDTTP